MMTVAELIAQLQQLDGDALVLVQGFDSWGYDFADVPAVVEVVPVKPTSHGPSFVENAEHMTRHHEVTGAPIAAVFIDIGEQ